MARSARVSHPEPNTHTQIDRGLCGAPVEIDSGSFARVRLTTDDRMAADDRGLVHGGFLFGAADYAAMLAVDDPHVVLGAASVRFTGPVEVGAQVEFDARVEGQKGKKREVAVVARVGEREVFTGTFTCFVLEHHVLDGK